jgi:serine/threonine-protein kinase
MGVVYLAQQLALDRRVALKVINPDLSDDAEFRERFTQEAQLAAAIDHRQIIPVYDAGEADGRLFLSMRYVKGLDLRTVLQLEGPLDPERALGIAGALADALDAAHAVGLVHRDVKPANVLIEDGRGPEPERVYLTDFGLTKRVSSSSGLTRTGIFVGTPDYASPEQAAGKPVDGRTDEYSLACVLHECLTGVTPFPRDSDAQVLAAHLMEPPPAVSSLRPGLPAALDAVLAKAMAKDRDQRFPTCDAMVEAAHRALAGGGATVVAPPPAPAPPFVAGGPGPPPGPGFSEAPTASVPAVGGPTTLVGHRRGDEPPRRRWTWLVAAIVVLLAAGGVAAVLVTTGGSDTGGGPSPSGPTSASPTSGPSPSGSTGASPALTAYIRGADDLLTESGEARQRLVAAVGDAGSGSPTDPSEDVSAVRDVIAQRRSAIRQVTTWAVPPEAALVNQLLETAFRDAVADDQNYLRLVRADLAHDDAAATQALDALRAHRAAATDPDKDAFVRAYDVLRQQAGEAPLPPGFSF